MLLKKRNCGAPLLGLAKYMYYLLFIVSVLSVSQVLPKLEGNIFHSDELGEGE